MSIEKDRKRNNEMADGIFDMLASLNESMARIVRNAAIRGLADAVSEEERAQACNEALEELEAKSGDPRNV